MRGVWPVFRGWLSLAPLRRRLSAALRLTAPVDPPPTIPVELLMARVRSRLHGHPLLADAPTRGPNVFHLDDASEWPRLQGCLQAAECNRNLTNALPALASYRDPFRSVALFAARVSLVLNRGVTNRQTRHNEAVLAYLRGISARLQACEILLLEQETQLKAFGAPSAHAPQRAA